MGLRSYFGIGRQVEDRTLTRENVPAVMLSSPPSGAATPRDALSIADAYAAVRVLADAAASLPLHVYRRTDDGRARLDNATAELLRRPAPAVTTSNFIGQVMAHLNLWGSAFAGKYRDADGRVSQLGLLAPDRVTVAIQGGQPVYVLTGLDGRQTRHGVDDIVHIRGMSVDGLTGLSPVRQARVALGLSDSLAKHAAVLFENSAVPRGILRLNSFGEQGTAVDELKGAWEGRHQGGANAGRVAVIAGEVDFLPIEMEPGDAEFLESRRWSAVEVARCFRIPPHMIGAPTGDSLTYATVEQESLEFVTYSLRPWLVAIEQALSADRDLFTPNTFAEFQLDGLLRADAKTRAEIHRLSLDPIQGWQTREEVRRLENLPPERTLESPTPEQTIAARAPRPAVANANGKGVG